MTEKRNKNILSDKEVLELLNEQAKKQVQKTTDITPALPENALKAVIDNVKKKGEVWKKSKKKK